MQTTYEFILPISGSENTPQKHTLKVPAGILDTIEVGFPLGCERLARLKIFYHTMQILPYNLDSSLGFDDYIIKVSMNLPLDTEPFELELLGWNEDDLFEHTLSIAVNVIETGKAKEDTSDLLRLTEVIDNE